MTHRALHLLGLLAWLVGIVALAVIAGAILVGQDLDGWIVGLVVGGGTQILTMVVILARRSPGRGRRPPA